MEIQVTRHEPNNALLIEQKGCALMRCIAAQILEDMLRYFPRIDRSQVTIKQIDSHDHILSAFDRTIAEYATEHFRRSGIDLVLACRVRCTSLLPHCFCRFMGPCCNGGWHFTVALQYWWLLLYGALQYWWLHSLLLRSDCKGWDKALENQATSALEHFQLPQG